MNTKTLRHWVFTLHRYLGFAIGLILIIVGLTGSLLVFYPELDQALIEQQVGAISVEFRGSEAIAVGWMG